MKHNFALLLLGILLQQSYQLEYRELVIIILSQDNTYNVALAEQLKQDVVAQSYEQDSPVIHFAHKDFPHAGAWTILPLIPTVIKRYEHNASWIIFCQERTRFRLHKLVNVLSKYDHKEEIWLGHSLRDKEPTIIHHFALSSEKAPFLYPNVASGFAVSLPLLKRLLHHLHTVHESDTEFSIDASHELALFAWNNGDGVPFTNDDTFCIDDKPYCASYILPFTPCTAPVQNDNILFAVKTCKKYHRERVPIVKNTWGKFVKNINFYSEEYDEAIPTVNVQVPNTEHGHCGKTLAILRHVSDAIQQDPSLLWVVITDDDTILSSTRIQRLLSCYDSSERVAIGERYGFRVLGAQGYNYITGGGGMVFSAPLVQQLTAPGVCECPSIKSPDDMFLGVCLARLGVNITHSSSFHQARPPDYARDYLRSHEPISFHKHWMIDPLKVYQKWFLKADLDMSDQKYSTSLRTEL